ncbi:hypothetical protein [Nocardioides sp. LS1]|uniref:hypothetical protein n=1 Tax=Nocardioides sp. LS1 TaxID=1027620 RepID=UPI000F62668E|nr:hypothetical protein [Nocardioides sp. LS1]GCD91835.1 hypothetical protein NLS1_38410 [Nocardioides sp. LS1]
MTISLALRDLRDSTQRLSEAVTELVMITHEDRPDGSEVAAVDHFAEQVTELQSSVVAAGQELLGIDGPTLVSLRMPVVDEALAAATTCYWRDLRSYAAVGAMRQVARRGGRDWRAWQGSVEQSQQRCEQPLLDAVASSRRVWMELAELITLWLRHPPAEAPPPDQQDSPETDTAAPITWRTS